MILELRRQGLGVSAIARQTGLDRKTVRKYLAQGLEAPVYGPRARGERLAEQFRAYLSERVEAFPGLSARRLHREVRAMGYKGAYSSLTEYLRLIRPAAPRQFERRFETAPGQQAQVDFAEFQVEFVVEPGILRKVWLFSMVLGHSRWLWGRFCPNQTLETVMRCHITPHVARDKRGIRQSMDAPHGTRAMPSPSSIASGSRNPSAGPRPWAAWPRPSTAVSNG